MSVRKTEAFGAWLAAVVQLACSGDGTAAPKMLTREELLKPETCADCHPTHYREWASSMHAYAADDPVFIAMNQRGQREAGLGPFCVECHAPMAVREGAIDDYSQLADVPQHLKGVTCYFCHNATGAGDHFNNSLTLANDTTMRAGIRDAIDPGVHGVRYSEHHDRNRPESSVLCGSCHDIVTPAGVHLERTFAEYQGSLFSGEIGFDSCQGCHMDARPGFAAAVGSAPARDIHSHLWPGVDVALTPFSDTEVQRLAIECALAPSARIVSISHDGFGRYTVLMETNAGHHQPSGAAQDRRLWLELIAYDANGNVLLESGTIADDEIVDKPADDPEHDPNLTVFRDYIYDSEGNPTHDFWDAAPSDVFPEGYRSAVLPAAVEPRTPHGIAAHYQLASTTPVARITARLRMRPIGLDVLADLVATKDLEETVLDRVPTFTLHGASVEWLADDPDRLRSLWPDDLVCPEAYLCVLEPARPECDSD